LLATIRTYTKAKFGSDLIAGLTVATILVPQGLAYAMLMGVSPIYGLYTGLVPLLIYVILGTSRYLSIGPVAISSLLVLAGVGAISEPGTSEYLTLVILAGLLIGMGQMILGVIKMGFIVNFISHPVMSGFASAAAIIIISTQLKDGLGISIPRFEHVYDRLGYAISHIGEVNVYAALLCVGAILTMLVLKKIHRSIPGALIVIIVGTLLTYLLGFQAEGLEVVGSVPSGLPSFEVPSITWEKIRMLFPVVLTVTTIGIVESVSIAKVLEAKNQVDEVDIDQELIAIGMSKIVGSFFQSIPSSGSFSRSAVNSNVGAKSTMASLFTAILVCLSLLFLTPLFYYLPLSVLASIILIAVVNLFDVQQAIHLWKTHKSDFALMIITFVATLMLGIQEGVLIGVVLSIASVLLKSSKPHIAILGRIPETNDYRNIRRFTDAIEPENGIVIRFDDQLYFANADYFKEKVKKLIKDPKYSDLSYVVLDASNMHDIDSTGIKVLNEISRTLNAQDIVLHMCSVKGPVRDRLYKNEMLTEHNHHHLNIKSAIGEMCGEELSPDKKKRTMQSNHRSH